MDDAALARFQMHGQDVPWLLGHWAEHRGAHPGLVWEPASGVRRVWTYAELHAEVRRLAAGLVARGITAGDKVLVHSENSPEMVLSWLACATVGAVAVTTNTKSVLDELAYFVEKARCVAAITQPRYAALVIEAGPNLEWVAVTADDSGAPPASPVPSGVVPFDDLFGDSDTWLGRPIDPMQPLGIMFTSGTTSRPKAVLWTHANAVWSARIGSRNIDLGPDDAYVIYAPFFHTNAQSWSFLAVLGVGATAVLMPKWSASRYWEVVTRNRVTHTALMGFAMPTIAAPDRPSSTLRTGVFGFVSHEFDERFGLDVYGAFGMTETVTHSTIGRPTDHLPDGSMGHVTPGYEVAVVDPDTGELCHEGEHGELWFRGTRGIQLFLEYFDDPVATEAAFEDGWFKTGDVVEMAAGGALFYRERDKDVLKVGGENVSAREVEDVVVTVPGVAQAAVVGKADDRLDEVVVAFVIATPDVPDESELERAVRAECASRLATFKVPKAVYVVDDFPRGLLDKILKKELREMANAQPPV